MKFDEFMEDIQNDIRQARLQHYWKQYGKIASGFFTGLLVLSVIYTLYQNHASTVNHESSALYLKAQQALMSGKVDDARAVLKQLGDKAPQSYKMLALFEEAGLHLKEGSKDSIKNALDVLKKIEDMPSIDSAFKTVAKLLRYLHSVYTLDKTSDDFQKMRLDLDALIQKQDALSSWAKEIKAIMLYQLGSPKEASELLIQLIQSPDVPQHLQIRAQLFAQHIAQEIFKGS